MQPIVDPKRTTLFITNSCSASCTHCPYAKNGGQGDLTIEEITKEIPKLNGGAFVTITGGEPFEHKDIDRLLSILSSDKNNSFRIATGGHVPLNRFVLSLRSSSNILGLAVGTDILISSRNKKSRLKKIWRSNIILLKTFDIPYSITITMGNDFSLDSLLNELKMLAVFPDFFMLSEIENKIFKQVQWESFYQTICDYYPEKKVINGFRNSFFQVDQRA